MPVGGIVWEQLWEDMDGIYTDQNDVSVCGNRKLQRVW